MNAGVQPVLAGAPPRATLAAVLLVAAIALTWGNSLHGPFLFDDLPSIRDNATLRDWRTAFRPESGGLTVSGRPLLNASFALNHALGGERVEGYHALNLLIHAAAALTLLGILRRTFRLPRLAPRFGPDADGLALGLTALWALHPLQTESVTYLAQRAESLGGLCYLLTLYAFLRGATAPAPRGWLVASGLACLAGSLAKETVATAPVLLLLYDRTFLAGSFAAAWRARSRFYLALAATWLVVAALVLAGHGRGGSAGFGTPASPVQYALLQLAAIPHYLRLAVWPQPLVFDYGPFQDVPWPAVLRGALVLGPGLVLSGWLLWRRPAAGFVAVAFFLLLAPSSSVVPVASQVMAEHRMYLPLGLVVLAAGLGLHAWRRRAAPVALALLAVAAGAATWQRNRVYQSPLQLWLATADAAPDNPRALLNAGQQLAAAGRAAEAEDFFQAALRRQPNYVAAHGDLGLLYLGQHRPAEAAAALGTALRLNPDFALAAYNLGLADTQLDRLPDAAQAFATAARLEPGQPKNHYNLGNTLVALGRLPEAVGHYRTAAQLAPDRADIRFNLANALFQSGRAAEAVPEYEAVLQLTPGDAEAAHNLALARQAAGIR